MIICIQEIYENETAQAYFIDTNLAKTKEHKKIMLFLMSVEDSVSVPYSELLSGCSGLLSLMEVKPPCHVEKLISLHEDESLSFKDWINSISPQNSKSVPVDMNDVFYSIKAELSDGTPMQVGIMSGIFYEVVALKDLKDQLKKTIAVHQGEKCKICFLGYAHPSEAGFFYNYYKAGYTPKFKIGKESSKNVSQDYIWLEQQPIFGEDFALLKNK